jgi:predicted TIM-barrel fold metal-dependent hydrolase
MNNIETLLHGSIDMHAHYGPDAVVPRKLDALMGAQLAREAGMRAIVLKCHHYCTAPLADMVSQAVPNIAVFGSICLNAEVGGLNPAVVEAAARQGAKVIWMPTNGSTWDYMHAAPKPTGISILSKTEKWLSSVSNILATAKKHDMIVATGHLQVHEVFILVEEALAQGLTKFVVTHPLGWKVDSYFTLEQMRRIADMGAFVEYCFVTTLPKGGLTVKEMAESIKAVGAERCVLSTDLGQADNPAPVDGMRMMIAAMLDNGLSEKEIEVMIKTNPAKLLGMD